MMRENTSPKFTCALALLSAYSLLAGCDPADGSPDTQETGEETWTDTADEGSSGEVSTSEQSAAPTAWQPDDLANLPSPPSEKLFPPDEPQDPDEPQYPPDEPPAPPVVRKAMTWTVLGQQTGNIHVGADQQTNAYGGDTTIDKFLPILCVLIDGRAAPNGIVFDAYNGWVKGAVQMTPPVPGVVLTSRAQGDAICADTFGTSWRLAEFHDASGGWSYWATAGQQVVATPGTRFWVAINDQPANPWNAVGSLPTSVATPRFVTSETPVPNQYLAMFPEGTPAAEVQALSKALLLKYGGTVLDVFPGVGGFSFTATQTQAQTMSQDPGLEYVEQDSYGQPAGVAWHQDRVDQHALPLSTTYTPPNDGDGVNIYILDTGFRRSHAEFGGRARQDADFIRFVGTKDDCNGHGTAVGSTAAGGTLGIARKANLISVRIAGCQGNAYNPAISVYSSTIVAGLDWVARNHVKPAVANVSYGFLPGFWRRWFNSRTPMDRAVSRAVDAGVTVVVSAGNENKHANRSSPARAAAAISVSATTKTDARWSSANYGKVELFAPGQFIPIAGIASDTQKTESSGTSFSAPMVAGAAAIYLHDYPTASPAQVRNHLLSVATPDVVSDPRGSSNRLLYVTVPPAEKAMTWTVLEQRPNNIVHVGADAQTNPYTGDTSVTTSLPLLCARTSANMIVAPPGITINFHNGWLRGEVKLGPQVQGKLPSRQAADTLCANGLGNGWRMAEFHDGWHSPNNNNYYYTGGWTFWGYGTIAPNTRFWVAINDQTTNLWD